MAARKRRGKARGNKVIVYIRVSDTTGREETLISDDVQLNECRRLAKRDGLEIVDVISDLDMSGRKFTHRSIAKIIDRVEDGQADGVLVWKISRWGRNTMDSLLNIGELQKAGGFILSATENLDDIDTPHGKFSLTVMLAIAQLFSDEIGKVWANIHDWRRENGKTHAGTPRLGYIRNKAEDRYEIDPVSGPWVRKAYEEYVGGKSLRTLAAEFNAGGIKSTRGNRLTYTSLKVSLDSGFAAGYIVDRRGDEVAYAPGAHPSIIEESTWQNYQRRRQEKTPSRRRHAVRRLSGLMVCSSCGHRMQAIGGNNDARDKTGKKTAAWRCPHVDKVNFTTDCPERTSVMNEKAERLVLAWAQSHSANTESGLLAAMARQQEVRQAQKDVDGLRRQLAAVDTKIAKLAQRAIELDMSTEIYKTAEQGFLREKMALKAQLSEREVSMVVNDVPAGTVFDAITQGWNLEPAALNEALKMVIRRIEILPSSSAQGDDKVRIVPAWQPEVQAVA